MTISIYHVDAFTDQLFHGNPAAVCVLAHELPDAQLHAIVAENNLPATVFLKPYNDNYHIRWFTPEESNLCGHGTLAASFVIFNQLQPQRQSLTLHSSKTGLAIPVQREKDFISFDFPLKPPTPVTDLTTTGLFEAAFGVLPIAVYAYAHERCLAILTHEAQVKALQPDMAVLKKLPYAGIVATAPSDEEQVDFVSRTFYPTKPVYMREDAVTGASHCLLTPYWAEQLGKSILNAKQVSARGGFVQCTLHSDHINLRAKAVLYSQGTITQM